LSKLADTVRAITCAGPISARMESHIFVAERLHGDHTGLIWVYSQDDRPLGWIDPLAAIFYSSKDQRGENPAERLKGYSGDFQAYAYR